MALRQASASAWSTSSSSVLSLCTMRGPSGAFTSPLSQALAAVGAGWHALAMARTVQIVIDCADTLAVGEFWASALGYVRESPPPGFDTWEAALGGGGAQQDEGDRKTALVAPAGAGPRISLQKAPEPKQVKNRLHLDVRVSDPTGSPQEREAAVLAEVER